MKLLVLDPATSTGYCIVNIKKKSADIFEYGFIDVDKSSDFIGDSCIDLMNKVQELIDLHAIEHIAIEDFFFKGKYRQGSTVNVSFRTAIYIIARQNNIEYTILNISSWKKFVSGKSSPTKEQKKQWGALAAKKLYIQQALWDYFWFRFPNHSISKTTGKPIVFRYDIVDAVGMAIYYCSIYKRVPWENITLSVKAPKDVIFSRKTKKQFIY